MQRDVNEAIKTHYGRSDLADVILAALEKAGADIRQLSLEELAPIDEFHIRGTAWAKLPGSNCFSRSIARNRGLRSTAL